MESVNGSTSKMEESRIEENKRGGGSDYTCNIYCIKSLDEFIRAFIFKCFGFQSDESCSQSSSASDVKMTDDPPPPSSTTESDPSPSSATDDQPDINITDDMALPSRFRPPPRPQPTTGRGPQTNSAGSS